MGFFSKILAKALFKLGGLDKKLVEDKEITGYLKSASNAAWWIQWDYG